MFRSLFALSLSLALCTPGHAQDAAPCPDSALCKAPEQFAQKYADPELARLITAALAANTDIAEAIAKVAEARSRGRLTASGSLPSVDLGASATDQSGPLINKAGGEGRLFDSSVTIAWEPDLFGRMSKAKHAAKAEASAAEYDLAAVRLLVASEVAQNYVALRSTALTLDLAVQAADNWRQTLTILESMTQEGTISSLVLEKARSDASSTLGLPAELQKQKSLFEHQLAFLTGNNATEFKVAPNGATLPALPEIPAGLPSDLLLRRPDVHSAYQLAEAARDHWGIAKSAWFPSLSLTANGGYASPSLGNLLVGAAQNFGLSLFASLPLFDGGRRKARIGEAKAQLDAVDARYRATTLTAFREVADELAIKQSLDVQFAQTELSEAAAANAFARTKALHADGLVNRLELLSAERTVLHEQSVRLNLHRERHLATIALIRALGGYW